MPQVNDFSWTNLGLLLFLFFFLLLFIFVLHFCNLKKIEFCSTKTFFFFYLI